MVIRDILSSYEKVSGKKVNFDKTHVMFSKGIPQVRRDDIVNYLSIKEVLAHDKYLGLPTFVGRKKKKPFLYLKDRICRWLSSWMNQLVSWAGREMLIKVVA